MAGQNKQLFRFVYASPKPPQWPGPCECERRQPRESMSAQVARVVGRLALAPPRSAASARLVPSPDGSLLAVTTCGSMLHLLSTDLPASLPPQRPQQAVRRICAWRLPSAILLISWASEASLLVVTSDGSAWRLQPPMRASEATEVAGGDSGDGDGGAAAAVAATLHGSAAGCAAAPSPSSLSPAALHRKRGRTTASTPRGAAVAVGERERLPWPPLGPLDAAHRVSDGLLVWRSRGQGTRHLALGGAWECTQPANVPCPGLDALSVRDEGGTPLLVLPIHRGAAANGDGLRRDSAPLSSALFHALHGGGGGRSGSSALLLADADGAMGAVRCATLEELTDGASDEDAIDADCAGVHALPPAAASPLAALSEPALAILTFPAVGGNANEQAVDALMVVGRRGWVLVLRACADGSLSGSFGGCRRARPSRVRSSGRAAFIFTSHGGYIHAVEAPGAGRRSGCGGGGRVD